MPPLHLQGIVPAGAALANQGGVFQFPDFQFVVTGGSNSAVCWYVLVLSGVPFNFLLEERVLSAFIVHLIHWLYLELTLSLLLLYSILPFWESSLWLVGLYLSLIKPYGVIHHVPIPSFSKTLDISYNGLLPSPP